MKKIIIYLFVIFIVPALATAKSIKKRGTVDDVIIQVTTNIPLEISKQNAWLWDSFAEKPVVKILDHFTAKDWEARFDRFAERLISKAKDQSLDSESLKKILQKIKTERKRFVMLPVAAYSTNYKDQPAWIVIVNWESSDKPIYDDYNKDGIMDEGWPTISHTCIFAYDSTTLKLIDFVSCL